MRKRLLLLLLIIALPSFEARAATLTADAGAAVSEMSDTLYGLFLEDINHAVEGGLYAELLRNRSFEYQSLADPQRHEHFTGWQFAFTAGGKGTAAIMTESPLHENNPTYVRVTVEKAPYRLANLGYGSNALRGGVTVEKGREYRFFLYLRNVNFNGTVEAALTDRAGRALSQTASFLPGEQWGKFEARLTAAEEADAYLTLTLTGEGSVEMDMASLMPADCFGADWPGGGLRADLVEALAALKPRFLRFPGGCVAEGAYCRANFYDWKDTVGPVEQRREIYNLWGYMQSRGLGYFEYFCLAEALGAQPLPVVHAGVLCQAREAKEAPLTLEETRAYAQDILDLIEFATGGTDTAWGALRAEMGHPQPFDLRYLAIGNENWGQTYFDRYAILSAAVKEQYPHITCIVAAGPVAEGALIRDSWNTIRRRFPDSMADEHYYMEGDWFLRNTGRYDAYPRSTPVFLGEYAAHEPLRGQKRPNNLYSALCEAAYLTGIERNSDVVRMCCYAPLLARDGMQQWTPNLIWFSADQVLKTPNYYVQQMFSASLGGLVVESAIAGESLYHVATRTEDTLYVKIVSLSDAPEELALRLSGVPDGAGASVCLSGAPEEVNTFAAPDTLVPVAGECVLRGGEARLTLPACSVTVLSFPLR